MAWGTGGASSSGAIHLPVMADEAIEWLRVREEGIYVDCTVGLGGHAIKIARILKKGRLIALDRDPAAVAEAIERLEPFPHVEIYNRNYGELAALLKECDVKHVDGILLDAGISSMQLDDPNRGFAFQAEGPLDMRMDRDHGESAREFLAKISKEKLTQVLKEYGDVGPAKRIAATIIHRREKAALVTTQDLAEAVAVALPFVERQPDETRTVFQAIRMAVNEELRWLEAGLRQAIKVLAPGGRLVVIAFHSGEDRVVKQLLQGASRASRELYPDGRVRAVRAPQLRILTRKPVVPGQEEIRRNPRAHSAKLRAAERIDARNDYPRHGKEA